MSDYVPEQKALCGDTRTEVLCSWRMRWCPCLAVCVSRQHTHTNTHTHTHTHTHTNGHHSCVYMTPGTVFASACSSFLGCVSTREKYTHTHVCVCVCAGAVENVVFFAEVLFADGQYERALEVIQGRELERQDLRALLLAARCLVCVSVPLGVQNKKRKKQCGDAYCLS